MDIAMKLCPKCNIPLDFVFAGADVWTDDHLMCMECHGTYNLWDNSLRIVPSEHQNKNLENRNQGG